MVASASIQRRPEFRSLDPGCSAMPSTQVRSAELSIIGAPLQPSVATALAPPQDEDRHFPVFTLVHSRLMIRCVAASRAWITNSFFCVASSG